MSDEEQEPTGEVTPEQRAQLKAEVEEAKAIAKALKEKKLAPPPDDGYHTFIAPVEKNSRFLANPDPKDNPVVFFRDPASPLGKRDTARENDIWVEFTNGSLATKDPVVIAWCEANPEICRDTRDPRAATWAKYKEAQVPRADREALMDPHDDIDKLVYGESART